MKILELINEWNKEGILQSEQIEVDFFSINEIKIDSLNSYDFKKLELPQYTESFSFTDRCGNILVVAYIDSIGEFKSGYKIEGISSLVFQPENLQNSEKFIRPCPDDKKVNTVYKILSEKIIPRYILPKKPSKLFFNPVSPIRERLTDIFMNKVLKDFPQLIKRGTYVVHM
jgi:hypothetical protein